MKCIRCDKDCTYPQRSNRICPNCQGEFAFEPRDDDPISDAGYQSAINAISGQGKISWLSGHLYYEVARRLRKMPPPWGLVLLMPMLSFGLFTAFRYFDAEYMLLLVGAFLTSALAFMLLIVRLRGIRFGINETKFDEMFVHWCRVHGTPAGYVAPPERKLIVQRELESDLADYSFERAVICERADMVACLLANQFHFENSCAILSINGYPEVAFETVRQMLKSNSGLRVYVLHDATVVGCQVAEKLRRSPDWFQGLMVYITDLGLRPVHVGSAHAGLLSDGEINLDHESTGLDRKEVAWLRRHSLPLVALRPGDMLRRLFAAIQKDTPAPDTDPASVGADTYPYPLMIPMMIGSDTPDRQAGDHVPTPVIGDGPVVTVDSTMFNADATVTGAVGGADTFG